MKNPWMTSLTLALSALAVAASSQAQDQGPVKIGFITDMSSIYADGDGKQGAIGVQMAIDDFGGKVLGRPVEMVSADHQNKADIAASRAREWVDTQGVTMLLGGTNSAAALAVSKVAVEKKRVFFVSGAGSTALTNEQCTPYTVHYDYDTAMLAKGTAGAIVARGDKNWFFLTSDYAFGHSLENDSTRVVKASGGTVVGGVKAPLDTSDFSSYLMQAQASKAQVLALANAGGDFRNAIKATNEFGLNRAMKIAGLFVNLADIHSLGLKNTQGLLLTATWDWNIDDESRAFGKRFYEKTKIYPTSIQASDYAATLTYLNAVKAAGTTDADKVMAQLKSMPISMFNAKGVIRPDGRFVRDVYLMQVKTPAESNGEWDLMKIVAKIDGDQAFTTKAESRCKLWQ
jgi:branched-chain amino acid transport system substrate-binding protein